MFSAKLPTNRTYRNKFAPRGMWRTRLQQKTANGYVRVLLSILTLAPGLSAKGAKIIFDCTLCALAIAVIFAALALVS